MNLTIALVPTSWALIADLLLLPIIFLIFYTFPKQWFSRYYNVFFAACIGIMLLWFMKAGIREGMEYHYLGTTLLFLMFGWQLAILGVMLEVLVLVIRDVVQWQVFSINVFLMGVIPVVISATILRLVEKIENNHFLFYFFIAVFFNAMITIALSVYIASMLMVAGGAYSYEYMTREYTPYIFLMIYPEAFLTGLVMIIAIVNFPQWVRSFDDHKYPYGSKDK
jgi:uncharacterized membrane protein